MEKHCCRICSKRFLSGKSLGGHMRSHLSLSVKPQQGQEDEKPSAIGGGSPAEVRGGNYELRENPRKTSRFYWDQQKRIDSSKECRECGKSFPSWKSLFGHMKCHSAAVKKQTASLMEEYSSTETFLMERSTASPLMAPKRRRRSPRGLTASSSSVSEFDSEVGQLAFNLVLLSRDSRQWWSSAAIPSAAFAAAAATCGGDTSFSKKRSLNCTTEKSMANGSDSEVENYNAKIKKVLTEEALAAARYECSNCKKIFPSFQALGGHRAAHKRNAKSCAAAAPASEDSAANTDSSAAAADGHECSTCGEVFCSGPALVGHMKSHLIAGDIVGGIVQQKDLFDLNLPAAVEI